jgi:hypothetical protein
MRTRPTWTALALAALCGALPPSLAGQAPTGPILSDGAPGWLPSVGVRAGLDQRSSDPAVGALVRLPIPVSFLRPAITPGADLVFHDGLTDRQATVDVTIDLFGISVGGGPVWLNSVYHDEENVALPRETRQGYSLLAGLRSGGRFGTSIELRWLFVDDLEPRFITLAFTFTPGAPRRGRGAFGP